VNRTADLLAEHPVDQAVLLDPAEACERLGRDGGTEVVPAPGEVLDLGAGARDRRLDPLLDLLWARHETPG